jgi:hypothetical protein
MHSSRLAKSQMSHCPNPSCKSIQIINKNHQITSGKKHRNTSSNTLTNPSSQKILSRPSQRLRLHRIRPPPRRPRSHRQHGPIRTLRPRDQSQPGQTTKSSGREARQQNCNLGTGKFRCGVAWLSLGIMKQYHIHI